jgi:hypothetical protein
MSVDEEKKARLDAKAETAFLNYTEDVLMEDWDMVKVDVESLRSLFKSAYYRGYIEGNREAIALIKKEFGG